MEPSTDNKQAEAPVHTISSGGMEAEYRIHEHNGHPWIDLTAYAIAREGYGARIVAHAFLGPWSQAAALKNPREGKSPNDVAKELLEGEIVHQAALMGAQPCTRERFEAHRKPEEPTPAVKVGDEVYYQDIDGPPRAARVVLVNDDVHRIDLEVLDVNEREKGHELRTVHGVAHSAKPRGGHWTLRNEIV